MQFIFYKCIYITGTKIAYSMTRFGLNIDSVIREVCKDHISNLFYFLQLLMFKVV